MSLSLPSLRKLNLNEKNVACNRCVQHFSPVLPQNSGPGGQVFENRQQRIHSALAVRFERGTRRARISIAYGCQLGVTGVRVERLQAMEGQTAFESDALKEGICRIHHGDGEYGYHAFRNEPHPNNWTDPCDAFHELWDSLNAAHGYGWDENPWVWVVEFRKVES
jgi:hypothetical protein